jgi:hypothetical protein
MKNTAEPKWLKSGLFKPKFCWVGNATFIWNPLHLHRFILAGEMFRKIGECPFLSVFPCGCRIRRFQKKSMSFSKANVALTILMMSFRMPVDKIRNPN